MDIKLLLIIGTLVVSIYSTQSLPSHLTPANNSTINILNVTLDNDCRLKCEFSKNNKNIIQCRIYTTCVIKDYSVRLWSDFDGYLGPLELSDSLLQDNLFFEIEYKGDEYKINTMSKYLVEVTNQTSVICSTEISRGCRIALLIAGEVGSLSRGQRFEGDEAVIDYTADSMKEYIIRPNEDAGCVIDIFAHTWSVGMDNAILNKFSPWLVSFKSEPYIGKGKLITSIEVAIQLRKDYEIMHNITYDWVYIHRYGMVYYGNITMSRMNLDLVYVSHWCTTNNALTPTSNQKMCRELDTKVFWPESANGIPDFYFAGNPANIDTVFVGMWSDTEQRKYTPGDCPELHNYFGGRLFHLHDNKKIQLGRYRYERMDFESLRRYIAYPEKNGTKSEYMFWWNNTVSAIDPNERPYLKKNYPYWNTEINLLVDHRIPRRNSYCGENTNIIQYCSTGGL